MARAALSDAVPEGACKLAMTLENATRCAPETALSVSSRRTTSRNFSGVQSC